MQIPAAMHALLFFILITSTIAAMLPARIEDVPYSRQDLVSLLEHGPHLVLVNTPARKTCGDPPSKMHSDLECSQGLPYGRRTTAARCIEWERRNPLRCLELEVLKGMPKNGGS